MLLKRSSANSKHGGSNSFKYKLRCSDRITTENPTTQEWLVIKKQLVQRHPVLLGELVKQNKQIVVKFGTPEEINKDYTLAHTLKDIPNVIKYYCEFTCQDSHVLRSPVSGDLEYQFRTFMCDGSGLTISSIIMPFYPLGDMNSYRWTKATFSLLKNVLKQAATSLLYAYVQHNFIQRDMHLDNILLRKTKKSELVYGDITIKLDTYPHQFYAIIMDFGKSGVAPNCQYLVYADIKRMFNLVASLANSDIVVRVNTKSISTLEIDNTPITRTVFETIWKVIDDMTIAYLVSERPPMPSWITQQTR